MSGWAEQPWNIRWIDMTTDTVRTPGEPPDLSFEEAIGRVMQADQQGLARAVADEVLRVRMEARQRIERARKEVEDGARARAGRFRL